MNVPGAGSLSFASQRSLQGQRLDKPVQTTISWTRDMHLEGRLAKFRGQVAAAQQDTFIWCDEMDVLLAEGFQLGREGGTSAGGEDVEHLTCLGQCLFLTRELVQGLLLRRELLRARSLAFDNETKRLLAEGPGVYDLARRGEQPAAAEPERTARHAPVGGAFAGVREPTDVELGCTVVRFQDSMETAGDADQAQFVGHVRVLFGNRPDPPTARSLYALVELDEEIKPEHFAAVAAAINFVERVRKHME